MHDLEAILAQINERTRLIFLDNPNNPTGTIFGRDEFEAFLARVPEQVIVVLDEAYVDFVDHPGADRCPALSETPRHRWSGLRTFSKAYGLAGLRIGYGMMHREIAGYLHRVRQPFNVNLPAQVGALAALDDDEHYRLTLDHTGESIAWLAREISSPGLPGLRYPHQLLPGRCRPRRQKLLRSDAGPGRHRPADECLWLSRLYPHHRRYRRGKSAAGRDHGRRSWPTEEA